MLTIYSLFFATLLPLRAPLPTANDSLPGTLVTTITTRGTFVSFDKVHADRFFLRDASDQMLMNFVMTAPETDLFLADHTKDDLKITYQVRDVQSTEGKTERLNYVTMLRSLKTGDDVRKWPQKLAEDSDRLKRCEKELRDLKELE